MNQEESEHNEVDGIKKGVDSTGEMMHRAVINALTYSTTARVSRIGSYSESNVYDSLSLSALCEFLAVVGYSDNAV